MVRDAFVAAQTLTGPNDRRVIALPHDRLIELLRKYNRLEGTGATLPRAAGGRRR